MEDNKNNYQNSSIIARIDARNKMKNMEITNTKPTPIKPVTPAFILTSDTGTIDGYYLGQKIGEVIGMENIESLQELRNMWMVYIKNEPCKVALTSAGVSIDGLYAKVHSNNPYVIRSGNDPSSNDNRDWIRLLIKDLRHSVSMDDVHHMLTKVYGINITSEIKYANYRDKSGRLTSLKNGDRFVLVHPDELIKPLPRHAQCGVWRCRLFHRGQFDNSKKECYNCFSDQHQGKNCPNPKACRVCKKSGHEPGNPACDYYHRNEEMLAFGGSGDALSNHFEYRFEYNDVPATCAENHWFHQKGNKNGQSTLGNLCLNAPNGKQAKFLGNGIRCIDTWDQSVQGYSLMKDIIKTKIHEVPPCMEVLKKAWMDKMWIVEAVPTYKDTFWGSGLDKEATLHTHPKHWPGRNMLGRIFMELADELFGDWDSESENVYEWITDGNEQPAHDPDSETEVSVEGQEQVNSDTVSESGDTANPDMKQSQEKVDTDQPIETSLSDQNQQGTDTEQPSDTPLSVQDQEKIKEVVEPFVESLRPPPRCKKIKGQDKKSTRLCKKTEAISLCTWVKVKVTRHKKVKLT